MKNIAREEADALLTKWADESREILLFLLHDQSGAMVTCWAGTLEVKAIGVFVHISEATMNYVATKQFQEISVEETNEYLVLRLCLGGAPRRLDIMLGFQKAEGSIDRFPLITEMIQ